jgi:type IV secretory pathway TraG/TraD family ATPase VirD4
MCGQTSVEDVRVSGTFGEERSYGQRPRELITPDEVRQIAHEHVIVFAGRKPPMMAHRLEWFNLFHDAQERVASAPPPELPELPRPEISVGGRERDDGRAEPEGQDPPPSDLPEQPRRKRREREREEGEEVGGYVEPDL